MSHVATNARADFERARRLHRAERARRRLMARRPIATRPRDLGDIAVLAWRRARLRSIPLEAIVGTVDATTDFDAGFRPATDRISSRWQRVARAQREGRPLPPIAVIERADGYYVLDGRHRVSVARALGQREIDAWASPTVRALPSQPQQPPAPRSATMTDFPRRLFAPVVRALREDQPPHFHSGDQGRPYVCHDPRCSSPSLEIAA
jgi:hypothetical protein